VFMKFRRRRKKDQRGFTLIELLVVLAILAILAIIAIPRVLSALREANKTQVEVEVEQIQRAMDRYYLENNEFPQDAVDGTNPLVEWEDSALATALDPYLNAKDTSHIYIYEYDPELTDGDSDDDVDWSGEDEEVFALTDDSKYVLAVTFRPDTDEEQDAEITAHAYRINEDGALWDGTLP